RLPRVTWAQSTSLLIKFANDYPVQLSQIRRSFPHASRLERASKICWTPSLTSLQEPSHNVTSASHVCLSIGCSPSAGSAQLSRGHSLADHCTAASELLFTRAISKHAFVRFKATAKNLKSHSQACVPPSICRISASIRSRVVTW